MPDSIGPTIAIVGSVNLHPGAPAAAVSLGNELAKAGLRIIVYSGRDGDLEGPLVHGYTASKVGARRSIEVRYPLNDTQPEFPERQTNPDLFDPRPDGSPDWTMSFYQSLSEGDGILIMGGGETTRIAGLVAMGYRTAVLTLPCFGGAALDLWKTLLPGRDLPTADERALMARPDFTDADYAACIQSLKDQIARKAEAARQQRLEEIRRETNVSLHAVFAFVMFLLSVIAVPVAWGMQLSAVFAIWLLFMSPLLAGVAGSTSRLILDLRDGSAPMTTQSTVTTAALGLIAGGVAGLLFITAQVTTAPAARPGQIISPEQASKLVPFGILIGFVAGLTLDAVFRKLISSDVVDTSAIEIKRRP